MKINNYLVSLLVIITIILFTGCGNSNKNKDMKKEFEAFVKRYEDTIAQMDKDANLAYWNASITGKSEDFQKNADIEIQRNKVLANKDDFALLKKIKESNAITDSTQKRELDVIYNVYLEKQADEKKMESIVNLENEIEKKFNTFRTVIGKDTLTDNKVEEILSTSTNSEQLKNTWMACKKIGPVVSADVIKIVKLRNEVAKELGFKNYHEMSLTLSDQNPQDIDKIFNELDSLTRNTYASLKDEIDSYLAKRLKIKKEDIKPWHYQDRFFQAAPKIYKVDLDQYYKNKDIASLTQKYYSSIGLDIIEIIKNSDLFEKPGKNQHAFCTDIDNKGDVRVLCNIKPNANWMGTSLHEFGHASYDKYINIDLPYSLREPAHTFTTEAIAMMFGRFSSNPQWLKDVVEITDQEKQKIAEESFKVLRLEQLVFSRWAQVMYHFEKEMYTNPDQDLNKLWWDMVEKYQMIKKPADRNEPDWATKIHIAAYPCYYHNYLLGELLASQLYYYITKNIIKSEDYKNQSFYGNAEVGKFLKEKVFMPGKMYYWNDMIEKATGEKLTAKYYAKQFVN